MKMYFDGVKVGDKVWDFQYGWGEVISFWENNGMMLVNFNKHEAWYNLNGVRESNTNRILFWNEIKFEVPQKPKVELKEGTFSINFQSDNIINYSNNNLAKNGLTRNDKKTAEKALKQIKRFARLSALRDQECPDSIGYEYTKNKNNYYIYQIEDSKEFGVDYNDFQIEYKIYFKTKEDAELICDILNSGKFDLEGE